MKNNVIGSRQTMMNSLNKIAPSPRKGTCFITKPQIPKPKTQGKPKLQSSNHSCKLGDLTIEDSLGFGIWGFPFHAAFFCSPACFAESVTKTSSKDGPIS